MCLVRDSADKGCQQLPLVWFLGNQVLGVRHNSVSLVLPWLLSKQWDELPFVSGLQLLKLLLQCHPWP